MAPDELYILPEDVRIIPVKELAEQAKTKFEYNDGDFVLTHSNSRVTSKIIDASSADLLKVFREPRSLVHGVFRYSILNKLDPGETLDESYPFLTRIRSEGFLKLYNENFSEKKNELIKPGEDFQGYLVIERIMSMSDTEIYKIKKGNTFFAVKILKTENANSVSPLHENFRNEIEILEILDGCVSPRLIEIGEHDGNKFIIMEWCEGISSDTAIRKYSNLNDHDNFTRAFTIIHNILEAYQRLHKKGIIHSDIHPRNVLVGDNDEVKIIDFGLARIDNSSRYTLRGGMGFFFEPEYAETVLKGETPPESSFAGEQYSVAALIYHLVTGKHYAEFSFEKDILFKQILNDPPIPFEKLDVTIDPEIQSILFKALSKKPGDRFVSMEEFSNCIFKAVQNMIQSDVYFAPDLAYSYSSFCSNLKAKYGNNSKLMESGLMLSPTSSVNYGAAGIAYMFYRMACIENDPELLCIADIWSNRSLDYQDETKAFYSADIEITPQTVGTISIYHTESGAQLVQSLISKTLGDYRGYHKAVSDFITNSSRPCENPDLTLGKAGSLIGASILLENSLPGNAGLIENLKLFGDNKMNEIWEKLDTYGSLTEKTPVSFFGIAHGWAGILYATLKWCMQSGSMLPSKFFNRIEQLFDLSINEDDCSRWRLSMSESVSWPGWCHGSAGYTFLWSLLYQKTNDAKHIEMAERAARHFLTKSKDGINASLCCGSAGQAYALLNLYRATNKSLYLNEAKSLSKNVLKNVYSSQMRNHSLYKGDVGAAILFTELNSPGFALMPLFE